MRGVQGPRARGARRRGPAPAPPRPAPGPRGHVVASRPRSCPRRARALPPPRPLALLFSPTAAVNAVVARGRASRKVRVTSAALRPGGLPSPGPTRGGPRRGRREAGPARQRLHLLGPAPPLVPPAPRPRPRPGKKPYARSPAVAPAGAVGAAGGALRVRGLLAQPQSCGSRGVSAPSPRTVCPGPAEPTPSLCAPRVPPPEMLLCPRSPTAAAPRGPQGQRSPPPGLWVPRPQGGWIRCPGPRCAAAPGVGPVNSAGSALARGFSAAESEVTLAAGVLSLAAARALQSCWGARGRLRAGREPRPGRWGGPPSALEPAQLPPRNQGGRAAVPGLPAPQGRWQRPPVGEASSRAPGLRAGVRIRCMPARCPRGPRGPSPRVTPSGPRVRPALADLGAPEARPHGPHLRCVPPGVGSRPAPRGATVEGRLRGTRGPVGTLGTVGRGAQVRRRPPPSARAERGQHGARPLLQEAGPADVSTPKDPPAAPDPGAWKLRDPAGRPHGDPPWSREEGRAAPPAPPGGTPPPPQLQSGRRTKPQNLGGRECGRGGASEGVEGLQAGAGAPQLGRARMTPVSRPNRRFSHRRIRDPREGAAAGLQGRLPGTPSSPGRGAPTSASFPS
ncbi:collagen alpha-1(I) chain-like isoform X2 [Canis lupus familiaris]|uniref:collagen alpha-1(I) chain-like isoform X2 n=1 Tax=Canis lupus familiaris TaxID=9615 RepID=UPI0015F1A19E|nr:collagen alpha-1(I) chain-like isoform X2 [Canis lupus familiaris]